MAVKTDTDLLKQIGTKLRKIRLQKEVSPKEMASALSITTQAYNNIENGRTNLNISQIMQISQFLKIDFNEVLDVENKRIYNFTTHNNPNSTIQNGEIHNASEASQFNTILSKLEQLIEAVTALRK